MIKDIDSLTQPIINIYSQIELDLIIEIAKRFEMNDEIGGTLEWQLKKLDELGALNNDTLKVISKYSKKSEAEILKMIEKAELANINLDDLKKAYNQKQIAVDPLMIKDNTSFTELAELTYKELKDTYRLIQTKALESAKQAYMDIVNRSYVEVATGTYDYGTSIRRAVKQMAQNGINGATYIRNGKTVQYSIESTVRRDTLTAVNKLANKASEKVCDELGAEYVEISSHLGARVHPTNPIANHAGWQGKVFKVIGSDGKYPNLKESTGYPDDIQGLGGVNCRHRMFPFFPGISVPNPIQYDEEENRRVYELSQKQRAMERKMRRLKKQQAAAKAMGDSETAKKLNKDIQAQSDAIQAFCDENGLRRDHGRELVSEQLIKKKDIANSENSGIIKAEIEMPIEQRNTGKGNPNAILTYGVSLNNRQKELLKSLIGYDSMIQVPKKSVKMSDLAALTAETGDEFALFTKGNKRLVIRGNKSSVNIDVEKAVELANAGYKWSGHTHPGMEIFCLQPSDGDYGILSQFKQDISVIYNSKGSFRVFGK